MPRAPVTKADWKRRRDEAMPYQDWHPFPPDAIVQVRSYFFPDVPDNIGTAGSLWWGYEYEMGEISESVIAQARRLDRPKAEM